MIEVHATSTCVLSFLNQNVYQGASAKAFLARIDLSAGALIVAKFRDLWDEIREEILNRRYGVTKFCHEYLDHNSSAQVIHLGCGLDPLPIDLAERYPRASFFDVDMANMQLKEEINRQIGGPNIAFITADLTDISILLSELNRAGWNSDASTLLVSEGISYYIPKKIFRNLLDSLQTPYGALVFEYSSTDHQLSGTPKGELIKDFFDRLSKILQLPLQRYDDDEVKMLAKSINGDVQSIMTQHELEFNRLGQNLMREDPRMGAVRVGYIQFPKLRTKQL